MKKTKPLLSKILAVSVNESKRLPNFYKKLYFAKHTTLKPPLFSAGHNEMFCLLSTEVAFVCRGPERSTNQAYSHSY